MTKKLEEAAARGVEALQKIIDERDQMTSELERLRADNAMQHERSSQLEARLIKATIERDHYMRYATELTAKLNSIKQLIEATIEEAKHGDYKPPLVPTPKTPLPALGLDAAAVDKMLKRLPESFNGPAPG